MQLDRRHFVELLLASGAFPAISTVAGAKEKTGELLADQSKTAEMGNSEAFWSNYYHPQRGGDSGADADRRVSYIHYNQKEKKLRFSQEIQSAELFPDPGDVAVTMNVTGIRLSQKDREKFKQSQSAQLRLDLAQNKPMFSLIDKLAWASVAALFVSEGKVPPVQDLSFSPDSTKDMILPSGTGLLGVNVSMTHRESRMYQVLQVVVKEVGRFAPVIGLPAISLTALNEFNQLYGKIEHRTTFLFQTTAPQRVFATKPARDDANTTSGINLVSGDYVLLPQEHVQEFQPHLSDFKLVSGYLVPANTDENTSVYQIADKITPDVSYVAVNIKVTPPWQINSSPAAPVVGSGGASQGSKDAGKNNVDKNAEGPPKKPKPPY